jgi:hypothetical protein
MAKLLKVINLFLLKRRIGYKKYKTGKEFCYVCIAGMDCFCDRYKFKTDNLSCCKHFAPKQISEWDRTEIEKTNNCFTSIFEGLKRMTG